MAGIWRSSAIGWELLSPAGFTDEAALHTLVAGAPQVLPLAGNPQLAVIGREVELGSGYADLLAVESTGRLAVIEVKLARNAEARRAVVAQALAYAAYLHGLDLEALESSVLRRHLNGLGFASLLEAARSVDQEGLVDPGNFAEAVNEHLAAGSFRVVFVLDDAPPELIRLIGYLEVVAERVTIDLITVASYDVDGTRVILPQRVAPDTLPHATPSPPPATSAGRLVEGGADFLAASESAQADAREQMRQLHAWATSLEDEGLITLHTFHGARGMITLLPWLKAERVGLVTGYNDGGRFSLQFWRSVFERRCPDFIQPVERISGTAVGQGNTTRELSEELLQVLTEAYRVAAH
ncbi:MAG: hypothetical protein GEU80_16420 [Dehalococcoidia bacterium]|nr:hypothetical protein [Dehalococcoidia bacterium]